MDVLFRAVRSLRRACFVAALGAALPLTAGAAPVNGDFEGGNTSGWRVFWEGSAATPLAYVAVLGPSTLFTPLAGGYSALVSSVSYFPTGQFNTSCANDLFNPNFCPPYPPTGVPSAANGGASVTHPLPPGLPPTQNGRGWLAQDIDASAGERIEWDWRLDARADPADFMFAALTNGEHFFVYATRSQAALFMEGIDVPNAPIQWLEQSFGLPSLPYGVASSFGFTLPDSGLWSLYLGISQMADTWRSAAFQVDNVRLTSSVNGKVSEPGALGLVLIAGALLLFRISARRAPSLAARARR